LLQNELIQRQIGNRLAQPAVLQFKVLQALTCSLFSPPNSLTPPIIRHLAHADLADCVHHVLALRDQNIDLPQLRDDLFRLVSLPCQTAGPAIHSKKGNVAWRVAGLLAAGSVPATVLTIWVLSRVPKQSPTTATIISMSMGVVLIIAAVAIFFRGRIRDYALARADNPTRMRYSGPITVVFGPPLGVLGSLCLVGAGALGVAVLFFLYPRLPPVRIVGSDLAHAVPLTLAAGLGHWLIGSVDWSIVGALLLGSLPGISVGSHVAARISD